MSYLNDFKQCLYDEANAILRIIDSFGLEIEQTCEVISKCQGKVVITGVGKSGHIGEKIAATLASTGTPSFFVHSTESVHGDLGMISQSDIVIMISNSGETKEVLNMLPSLKKIGSILISITRNQNSTLAKATDYTICYHYDEECDNLHLAPTISSTITLAIGDALAVTLSKMKGFTPDDFHLYHPGGSLGKMLEKTK